MHGCDDDAYNYATWAVAPWDSRSTQDWIAISVDGASGGGSCWSTKNDTAKVLAAIDDIRTCFYVHQQEIVLQGYSSGGEIAYSIALSNASRFAGLLIENSGLYSTGQPDALLAAASRKIPIAHLAHQDDTVFPLQTVQNDWAKIKAAGFPLQTTVVSGDHNGSSDDWVQWLHPKMTGWKTP
jgi:predicted esterase